MNKEYINPELIKHIKTHLDRDLSGIDALDITSMSVKGDWKFLSDEDASHIEQDFDVLIAIETTVGGILNYQDNKYFVIAKDLRDPEIAFLELRLLIPLHTPYTDDQIQYFLKLVLDGKKNYLLFNKYDNENTFDKIVNKIYSILTTFDDVGSFTFTHENKISALSPFEYGKVCVYRDYVKVYEVSRTEDTSLTIGYDLVSFAFVLVMNGKLVMKSKPLLKAGVEMKEQLYSMLQVIDDFYLL